MGMPTGEMGKGWVPRNRLSAHIMNPALHALHQLILGDSGTRKDMRGHGARGARMGP